MQCQDEQVAEAITQRAHLKHSHTLCQLEKKYKEIGLQYHSYAIHVRSELIEFIRQGISQVFQDNFVTTSDHTPPIIDSFARARMVRDDTKRDIRTHRFMPAMVALQASYDDLEQVGAKLQELATHLRGYFPVVNPGPRNQTDEIHRIQLRNGWVLSLPEVKKGRELGAFSSDDQAVLTTVWSREEEFDARADFRLDNVDGGIRPAGY